MRIWRVIMLRLRQWTLYFMTLLAVGLALVMALCTGYHFGRRSGTSPSSWQRRTSRMALGMVVANLLALVIARRVQRNLLLQRALPATQWLQLLRGSAPRGRSRR